MNVPPTPASAPGPADLPRPADLIVTIDGVAASGKSSVASGVARALGVPYLSSGLLYRAAALLALEARPTPGHAADTAPNIGADIGSNTAALLARLEASPLHLRPLSEGNEVWQGARDLTPLLHTAEVDALVSAVAAQPALRAWVNAQLRRVAPPFVAEGRDMGTAVFPQAQRKFYLYATPRVRAERRILERSQDLDSVEAALRLRDLRDAAQSAPAEGAVHIDTGSGPLEHIIGLVLERVPLVSK